MSEAKEQKQRFTHFGVNGPAVITWIMAGSWTWFNKEKKGAVEFKVEQTGLADIYVPPGIAITTTHHNQLMSGYLMQASQSEE